MTSTGKPHTSAPPTSRPWSNTSCRFRQLGPSAAIYVTAKEPDKDIDSSTKLVIVAVARARNTAMMLSSSGDEIIERGQAPIKMEPVRARITIARPARPTSIQNGAFEIEGAVDKTPYYLVEF